jgi:hypothetical protein
MKKFTINPIAKKTQQPLSAEEWIGNKPKRNQLSMNLPGGLHLLFIAKIAANNLANKEKVCMADIIRQAIEDYCNK